MSTEQMQGRVPQQSRPSVKIIRSSDLEVGVPGYVPTLSESQLNIFGL